jgi:hypothetical protein
LDVISIINVRITNLFFTAGDGRVVVGFEPKFQTQSLLYHFSEGLSLQAPQSL